jgi:hypothetical protein
MTRSLRRSAVIALVAAPLLFAACKQGVGDRCQVPADCEDGLLCVVPTGAPPQSGGTCQPAGLPLDAATADLPGTD